MGSHWKVIVPVLAIAAVLMISGCTSSQTLVKDLTPDKVVTNFWSDMDTGNYQDAYKLAYHADVNSSQKEWLDEHIARWGPAGDNIKIYEFNVINTYDENSSLFAVNSTEIKVVEVNATVAYMGHNTTGPLRVIVVNTSDGWKVFGNY